MSEEIVRVLGNEITDLHDRISRLAVRLQIDPGGSDRLDAIDQALAHLVDQLQQLERRVEALERQEEGE